MAKRCTLFSYLTTEKTQGWLVWVKGADPLTHTSSSSPTVAIILQLNKCPVVYNGPVARNGCIFLDADNKLAVIAYLNF